MDIGYRALLLHSSSLRVGFQALTKVPVPFFSVELDSKPSRISGCISRSILSSYSRKSHSDVGLLSDFFKELRLGVLGNDIIRHYEASEGTRSFGVHDSLRDTFPIECTEVIEEGEVL